MPDKQIICDITPFSMLDYPDITSCVLWFAGCNMRCDYCYNPDIVFGKGKISIGEALTFIRSRSKLLDGVVLSGGECTLHKETIPLAGAIKEIGMLLKVDTNGSNPDRIRQLIARQLIDYVSLDFKAMPGRFEAITRSTLYKEFEKTFILLQNSSINFEIRTTVHSALISENDLMLMADHLVSLGYRGKYYIQNFVGDTETVGTIPEAHKRIRTFRYPEQPVEIVIRS
ncbi:MAG: anaerobic ribonucleoside-triphosphate reductase activating protein [Chitinophagaceae bacterium]|nr:anaerobic ribonucleoside-triphosphate reductase activating protein [Chitinophagaceae bacterium]MCW5929253.1 anaerobic ribonucleoside-triphosphate reductase activating protein [Chitinophagaceae bacterium]